LLDELGTIDNEMVSSPKHLQFMDYHPVQTGTINFIIYIHRNKHTHKIKGMKF